MTARSLNTIVQARLCGRERPWKITPIRHAPMISCVRLCIVSTTAPCQQPFM